MFIKLAQEILFAMPPAKKSYRLDYKLYFTTALTTKSLSTP